LSASCARLGPGSSASKCLVQQASFQSQFDQAVKMVRAQRPDLIGEGDQVTSTGQYLIAMIKNLDTMGLCAAFDGEELAIKDSDTFNDQYSVLTSRFVLRQGVNSYRATCYPAAMVAQRQPVATAGCNLPPSTEITCDREAPRFYLDIEAAIDTVLADQPQIFDFTDVAKGTNWPKIVDQQAYLNGMVSALSAKGYCARWDGAELQVKSSSDFNEQYAIILSNLWIRRGDGIYRSTCWPAAF
jgi:hypothetical protein